jgi:flagellar hook-associated protein 3 FlgL
MKITEFMASSAFRQQVRSTRADTVKFNEEIVTGKRVRKASDDTSAFSIGKITEDLIRKNQQFEKSANTGLFHARTVQDSLDNMNDLMVSLKNLLISGANDTFNANDRQDMALQARSIRDDLVDLANSQFNDTFVFGGTNTDTEPFFADAAAAGGIGTNSTDRPLKVQVGNNTVVETSITGIELRDTPVGDLFEIMDDAITALETNNLAGIQAGIDNADETVKHLITQSTKTANSINRLDFVVERLEGRIIDQSGELSRLVDADIVDSMMNFQSAQSTLETVMATQARMSQTSLLNFLR